MRPPAALAVLLLALPALAQVTTLLAAGSTFAAVGYKELAFAFSWENPDLALSYTGLGSSAGKCRVKQNCAASDTSYPPEALTDFAGTDSIFVASDYVGWPDLQLFPSFSGAVVAAYNLPGISNLVLTKDVLPRIFMGAITSWADAAIVALNPTFATQLAAAGNINLVARADGSGTTEIWKKGLAVYNSSFSTLFASVLSDTNQWPAGIPLLRAYGTEGVAAVISQTPSSLGYISLTGAIAAQLQYAGVGYSFLTSDNILRATPDTVSRAIYEKGLNFGNNGDLPASHLTATAAGTMGSEAYPFAGLTYFAVRKNTTSTSCARRNALYRWLKWFYTSPSAQRIISLKGFNPLPAEALSKILTIAANSIYCQDGSLASEYMQQTKYIAVQTQSASNSIPMFVPPELTTVGDIFSQTNFENVSLVSTGPAADGVSIVDALSYTTPSGQLAIPYARLPWGLLYNFCNVSLNPPCSSQLSNFTLSLTVQTAVDILSGRITWWNDPAIVAQQTTTDALNLPDAPITVFNYVPTAREVAVFSTLVQENNLSLPSSRSTDSPSYVQAFSQVQNTPFSVTFGWIASTMLLSTLNYANFLSSDRTASYSISSPLWPLLNNYSVLSPARIPESSCQSGIGQATVDLAAALLNASVATPSDPLQSVSVVSLGAQTLSELSDVTCFGRSILVPVVDEQLISATAVIIIRAFAAFCIFAIGLFCLWVVFVAQMWGTRTNVPGSSASLGGEGFFLIECSMGIALQAATLFALTAQDESPQCMLVPWLFCLGVAFAFIPFVSRMIRFHLIFSGRLHLSRSRINDSTIQACLCAPVLVVLIVWQAVDPMVWVRTVTQVDPISLSTIQTAGQCVAQSNNIAPFVTPLLAIFFSASFLTLYLIVVNREHAERFTQTKLMLFSSLTFFEAVTLSVPILVISSGNVFASFAIKVLFVLVTIVFSALMTTVPPLASYYGLFKITYKTDTQHATGDNRHRKGGRASDMDAGSGQLPTGANSTPTVSDRKIRFETILENPEYRRVFETHLEREHAVESLLLWGDVQAFKAQYGDLTEATRKARAQRIFRLFFDDKAGYPVNVSFALKKEVANRVREGDHSIDLFDKASAEVFGLMQKDAFQRFVKTPAFKEISAKMSSKVVDLSAGHQAHAVANKTLTQDEMA